MKELKIQQSTKIYILERGIKRIKQVSNTLADSKCCEISEKTKWKVEGKILKSLLWKVASIYKSRKNNTVDLCWQKVGWSTSSMLPSLQGSGLRASSKAWLSIQAHVFKYLGKWIPNCDESVVTHNNHETERESPVGENTRQVGC